MLKTLDGHLNFNIENSVTMTEISMIILYETAIVKAISSTRQRIVQSFAITSAVIFGFLSTFRVLGERPLGC